jgi:hypothetical protein
MKTLIWRMNCLPETKQSCSSTTSWTALFQAQLFSSQFSLLLRQVHLKRLHHLLLLIWTTRGSSTFPWRVPRSPLTWTTRWNKSLAKCHSVMTWILSLLCHRRGRRIRARVPQLLEGWGWTSKQVSLLKLPRTHSKSCSSSVIACAPRYRAWWWLRK